MKMLSGHVANLNLFFLLLLAPAMALVKAEAFSGSLKHTTNLPVFSQFVSWKKQQAAREFSPHYPQYDLMDGERGSCLKDEAYDGRYTVITTTRKGKFT